MKEKIIKIIPITKIKIIKFSFIIYDEVPNPIMNIKIPKINKIPEPRLVIIVSFELRIAFVLDIIIICN